MVRLRSIDTSPFCKLPVFLIFLPLEATSLCESSPVQIKFLPSNLKYGICVLHCVHSSKTAPRGNSRPSSSYKDPSKIAHSSSSFCVATFSVSCDQETEVAVLSPLDVTLSLSFRDFCRGKLGSWKRSPRSLSDPSCSFLSLSRC